MKCNYACGTAEHTVSRRSFLGATGAAAAGALGLGGLALPSLADGPAKRGRQVLVFWLAGGASQLETWDPKPGTTTGGPFRSIETSVPGVRISELMPKTARQMHRLALFRGLNTKEDDHGKGAYVMHTGRPQAPGANHPYFGSLASRFLAPESADLPGYMYIRPGGGGSGAADAAYLGPKHGALYLGNGRPPANTDRPGHLDEAGHTGLESLRRMADERFARRRRTAQTEAYTTTYDQARRLMERREVFDVALEPRADQDRYGRHDLGRHCLLARRLLEAGVTYVQVSHSNYDTHNENFDFHLEQMGEFDAAFATTIDDLAARGLLDNTLVVVMSEFGRTPKINQLYGRDHWGSAWSVALAGGGVKAGTVVGATNDNGTEVKDGQANGGDLFHTYLRALGINPVTDDFEVDGRPIQIADPASRPIDGLLA